MRDINKEAQRKEAEINRLARNLMKLVGIFRQGGKANDFHWWNENSPRSIFYPPYGYQEGQPLFEAVVQGVLSLNTEMLSKYEVERKLVYEFLQGQTISITQTEHLSGKSLMEDAKNHLKQLIEFEAWQDVDIPIANLWLEGEPAKLCEVTFMQVTKEELEHWQKQGLWSKLAPEVHLIARVKAPGDKQKALSYAISQVNLALDVLRAFCFPFGQHSDTWRVGIVGNVIPWASTPARMNNRNFITLLGPGIAGNELRKHILSKLKQPQWELIDKLFRKIRTSKIERKLRDSIHWLAESTKPDTNNSKFVKISVALETLLAGEPNDENLQVRGITAMLAERAAFIAGNSLDDRMTIDKNIRTYYSKRSAIVHGDSIEVSLDDIDKFGELVRRLVLALLEKLDELGGRISNVERLANWVKAQKYTIPEHSGKEVA